MYKERPFVLTRSSFFGTQKYAAKWTGDNEGLDIEINVSISQMLTLGLSGIPFVGADIPGFSGITSQDIFLMFYQLGTFYPFMRAHGHLESNIRTPWN